MICPQCEADNDKVVDVRSSANGVFTRRRRECQECKHRFSTLERPVGSRRGFYTAPEQRPPCPNCGASGTNINKHGRKKGKQRWLCFKCRRQFFGPDVNGGGKLIRLRVPKNLTHCPACDSTNIEREDDGTVVCWDCPWSS